MKPILLALALLSACAATAPATPPVDAGCDCFSTCEAVHIAYEDCWVDNGAADAGCRGSAGSVYRAVLFCNWYCGAQP